MWNHSAQDDGEKNWNDRALAYMEQKYGEKFEYVAPWGSSMSGTHELIVSCGSLDGEVYVQIENYKKEDRVFRDNYLAVKYQKNVEEFMLGCAEEVFGEAKILYAPNHDGQWETLPAAATFEEYLADNRAAVMPTIVVKTSSFSGEGQPKRLAELVSGKCARYFISLSILADKDYDAGTWDSLGSYLEQDYKSRNVVIYNSDSEIVIEWTKE